jgi:hypothetical protein
MSSLTPARPLSFSILVYTPAPSPAKLSTTSFDNSIRRHPVHQVHQLLCILQCPMQAYHPQRVELPGWEQPQQALPTDGM